MNGWVGGLKIRLLLRGRQRPQFDSDRRKSCLDLIGWNPMDGFEAQNTFPYLRCSVIVVMGLR